VLHLNLSLLKEEQKKNKHVVSKFVVGVLKNIKEKYKKNLFH
jgi:uncharacterized protein YsxB (DUF464 family)